MFDKNTDSSNKYQSLIKALICFWMINPKTDENSKFIPKRMIFT